MVDDPWDGYDAEIAAAWLSLVDAVDAKWRAWVLFSDENRILHRVALGLSGLDENSAWALCYGYAGEPGQVVPGVRLAGDILVFPHTPIQPAWVYWCNLAADAIVEIMKARGSGSEHAD